MKKDRQYNYQKKNGQKDKQWFTKHYAETLPIWTCDIILTGFMNEDFTTLQKNADPSWTHGDECCLSISWTHGDECCLSFSW
jgi:hypothetical protein